MNRKIQHVKAILKWELDNYKSNICYNIQTANRVKLKGKWQLLLLGDSFLKTTIINFCFIYVAVHCSNFKYSYFYISLISM